MASTRHFSHFFGHDTTSRDDDESYIEVVGDILVHGTGSNEVGFENSTTTKKTNEMNLGSMDEQILGDNTLTATKSSTEEVVNKETGFTRSRTKVDDEHHPQRHWPDAVEDENVNPILIVIDEGIEEEREVGDELTSINDDQGKRGDLNPIQCCPLSDRRQADEKDHVEGSSPPEVNPFAKFAFGSAVRTALSLPRPRTWVDSKLQEAKHKKPKITESCQKSQSWIPFAELSADKQASIRRKWYGLIISPNAKISLEDARFQVMVASRLHARCQESVVRKCMTSLNEAGVLSCQALAGCDPEVLANLLTSLQYYNVKSKHLVLAAKQLLEKFDGMVPESKDDLLKITGIGPVMADLLFAINTRAAHRQHACLVQSNDSEP